MAVFMTVYIGLLWYTNIMYARIYTGPDNDHALGVTFVLPQLHSNNGVRLNQL